MTQDLLFIYLSLFSWGIGEGLFIYFQPLFMQQLGANPVMIGGLLSTMGVVIMLGQMPAGYLADHFGRRPVMWFCWLVGIIAVPTMAMAGNLVVFSVGLLLYGVTSLAFPPMNAYIAEASTRWPVGRSLTLASASFQLGAVAGPMIGGQLGQAFGLRTVYWVSAGFIGLSILFILFIHPQPIHRAEANHPHGHLTKNRRYLSFLVFAFIAIGATYLPLPLTSNYLQNQHHLSLATIGRLGSLGNLGSSFLIFVMGHITPTLAFVLGQISTLVFSILIWRSSGLTGFTIGYFFLGGYQLCRVMASVLIRPLVRPAQVGLAFGLLETVSASAIILAPALAGFLYQQNPSLVYPVSIVALGCSILGSSLFMFNKYKVNEAETGDQMDIREEDGPLPFLGEPDQSGE